MPSSHAIAQTGSRLVTPACGTIVDAAPIHQFARSRNNALNNGIALCKNAHWPAPQHLAPHRSHRFLGS